MPAFADAARHERMVELAQTMLDPHKALFLPGPEHESTLLARSIEAKDRQIDRLVYELDGLTEEEVRLVEGGGEWLPGEHFPKTVK